MSFIKNLIQKKLHLLFSNLYNLKCLVAKINAGVIEVSDICFEILPVVCMFYPDIYTDSYSFRIS
jgi:hypothetical protein